jgi:hypothetical protein
MAETKDYQLANKAKDLLIYSFRVTKPISDKSMETKDVLSTMLKLKSMKPEEVQAFCAAAADKLRRSASKQGFPKSAVHSYIKLIRETATDIVVSVQMANDCKFETEYEKRLGCLNQLLKDCNLMLQLILVSLELGYINIKRSEYWTKLVTDVKYITLSWRRKDTARAEKLREAQKSEEYALFAHMIADAIKEANG